MYSAGTSGRTTGRAQMENTFPASQYNGRKMKPAKYMHTSLPKRTRRQVVDFRDLL